MRFRRATFFCITRDFVAHERERETGTTTIRNSICSTSKKQFVTHGIYMIVGEYMRTCRSRCLINETYRSCLSTNFFNVS